MPDAIQQAEEAKEKRQNKIIDEVSMLLEATSGKTTTAQILGYVRGLDGLDAESVAFAVTHALKTCRFAPRPAELREFALAGAKGYGGMAAHAWEAFCQAVSRYGGDSGVSFDDGLINATVRMCGGWIQCCERTGDNFDVWLKKEFLQTYVAFCQSGASVEQRRGHGGRLRRLNAGYSDKALAKLKNINTGATKRIGSSVPVLAGPTERKPLPALEDLRDELPRLKSATA